jgi:hypothetical protein
MSDQILEMPNRVCAAPAIAAGLVELERTDAIQTDALGCYVDRFAIDHACRSSH